MRVRRLCEETVGKHIRIEKFVMMVMFDGCGMCWVHRASRTHRAFGPTEKIPLPTSGDSILDVT